MNSKVLERLFEKGYNADVVLSVKGYKRTLPAHRFVLSAASKYFETQLPMVKSEDNSLILDMSFNTMRTIIRFIYTKELQPEPTSFEEIEMLLKASDQLGVDILESLRGPISKVKNCANISDFMNLYPYFCEDKEIAEELDNYWLQNLKVIRKEKSFLSLTMDSGILQELTSSSEVNLDCEEDVFKTIEQWINHDYPRRHQHFPLLMKSIRYVEDDPKRIDVNFIMKNMLLWCNCKETKLHLIHLMALMAGYDSEVFEIITQPRKFVGEVK